MIEVLVMFAALYVGLFTVTVIGYTAAVKFTHWDRDSIRVTVNKTIRRALKPETVQR